MHERVGLPIIALNKAEALHCVEELHGARCLLTGQLPLRATCTTACTAARSTTGRTRASVTIAWRTTVFNRHGFAVDLQIGRRNAATAINQREPQRLPFGQASQAGLFDRTDVHEHVLAAVIADNKAKALLTVEKLYDPGAFANDLWGHAASSTAAATGRAAKAAAAAKTATAATAAAEAITAATAEPVATAAEAITTATKTVTTTKAAIESALAETIALVFATPATIAAAPFIETHALFVFPVRP